MAGKMVKPTSKTEFARVELLRKRIAEGFPGVTQLMLDNAIASANSLLAQEMKESVTRFMNKYGAEDWYTAARKMYDVVEENMQFRVVSKAANWAESMEWVVGSKWEAEAKIIKLIEYKVFDRSRGFGDMEKDIERMNGSI